MDSFDPRQFLPYLLNQAAEASSREFQRVYRDRYGMLRTEWRVLFHLGIFHRMTAGEICTRAALHKTKVSRAVARLEERRLLLRERDTDDRRVEWLELTAKGRAVYRDLGSVAANYDARLTEQLGVAQTAVLRQMLLQLIGET